MGGSIDTLAQTKGKQIYVKTAMYKVRKFLSKKAPIFRIVCTVLSQWKLPPVIKFYLRIDYIGLSIRLLRWSGVRTIEEEIYRTDTESIEQIYLLRFVEISKIYYKLFHAPIFYRIYSFYQIYRFGKFYRIETNRFLNQFCSIR